ncbi:MAG: hypothetical protein AAGJ46_15100 [Planctomycetota bacterium]
MQIAVDPYECVEGKRWTRHSCRHLLASHAALLVTALIAGCGPTTDRLGIRGEVRLDGEPIDAGSISFNAIEAGATLAAGAMIREGEFEVPRLKGLPAGEYSVSITAPDRVGPKVPVSPGPGYPPIMVARERVPPSYNINSTHTIELSEESDNYFEFDIDSTK